MKQKHYGLYKYFHPKNIITNLSMFFISIFTTNTVQLNTEFDTEYINFPFDTNAKYLVKNFVAKKFHNLVLITLDSPGYLKKIRESMIKTFKSKCQESLDRKPIILDSLLVSARTGFNIEYLISMIFKNW